MAKRISERAVEGLTVQDPHQFDDRPELELVHERVLQAMVDHIKGKPLALNERGAGAYEVPDPVPMSPPVGYRAQPSMADVVREMVRGELMRRAADEAGVESFEDADDFDVDDDYDPSSPWEQDFDLTPVEELRRRRAAAEAEEVAGGPQGPAGAAPSPDTGAAPGLAPSGPAGER